MRAISLLLDPSQQSPFRGEGRWRVEPCRAPMRPSGKLESSITLFLGEVKPKMFDMQCIFIKNAKG